MHKQKELLSSHLKTLSEEIKWLEKVIDLRLEALLATENGVSKSQNQGFDLIAQLLPPNQEKASDAYANFIESHDLGGPDRLLLILAMANHLDPGFWSRAFPKGLLSWEEHPEIGGIRGNYFNGFIPTGLTYIWLVGGNKLEDRLKAMSLFTENHVFGQEGLLMIEPHFKGEPTLSGRLIVEEKWVERLVLGVEGVVGSVKYAGESEG